MPFLLRSFLICFIFLQITQLGLTSPWSWLLVDKLHIAISTTTRMDTHIYICRYWTKNVYIFFFFDSWIVSCYPVVKVNINYNDSIYFRSKIFFFFRKIICIISPWDFFLSIENLIKILNSNRLESNRLYAPLINKWEINDER